MPDEPAPHIHSLPELQARLHAVAHLLRAESLPPQSRQALAELVDELGAALRSGEVPPAEVARLTQTTAELAEALHERHDEGVLAAARNRLQDAAVQAEARSPVVVGLVHRLLDALANIGI
jgi:hypothetical protein